MSVTWPDDPSPESVAAGASAGQGGGLENYVAEVQFEEDRPEGDEGHC